MSSYRNIAAIKRNRTARLARLVTKAYYLNRQKKQEQVAHLVYEEFISLGGVYVKFLQGVLLRSHHMKKWQSPEKLKIFENLDSEPLDIIDILQHELGPQNLQKITGIQPQPFAAGSFGQVYYGTHQNGKPIIVKVLRPMIRELLRYDLKLLERFSKAFVGKMYRNMDISLNSAIKEFSEATQRETDYIEEARFAAELYEVYKGHEQFIIPETYLDLCTSNIIVQEYVGGISAAQLIKLQEQGVEPAGYVKDTLGSDLDVQLEILGFELVKGIFVLPRIQGDPHPGNVRLLPDNKIGLIDFGISARSPENKAAFFGLIEEWQRMFKGNQSVANLFEQFIRFFVSDLYRSLKRLSTFSKTADNDPNFAQEVGKLAQDTFKRVTGTTDIRPLVEDGTILQVLNGVVNKENRFGLVMKIEASEILRAAQTYMTLVESLGRRNIVLPKVFDEVITDIRHNHPEIYQQQEDAPSISDALETVANWLERVAERDPELFRQLMQRIRPKASTIQDIKEPDHA